MVLLVFSGGHCLFLFDLRYGLSCQDSESFFATHPAEKALASPRWE